MEFKDIFLQYLDIAILIVIVIFLVFFLRRMLGKKIGYQRQESGYNPQDIPNKTPDIEGSFKKQDVSINKYPVGSLAYDIEHIKTKDANFNQKKFLESAKKAFEMIVKSFGTGEIDKIKDFISDNMFAKYVEYFTYNQDRYNVEIKEFLIADIVSVVFEEDGTIKIKVKFLTSQIKKQVNQIDLLDQEVDVKEKNNTDFWTFAKNANDNVSIWKLVSVAN